MRTARVAMMILAPLALAVGPAALARDETPTIVRVRSVAIEGVSGKALSENDLLKLELRLVREGGAFRALRPGDESPQVIPLWAVGRFEETYLDASVLQRLIDLVADAYGREGWLGTRVDIDREHVLALTREDSDGLLVIRVDERDDEVSPAKILAEEAIETEFRRIRFAGVSGRWLDETELLGVSVSLSKLPGGWIAPHPDLQPRQVRLTELLSSGRLVRFYGSGLQSLLDALSDAYTERGVAGVRIMIGRPALKRVTPPSTTGELLIEVSEGAESPAAPIE